ncbi:MAG TPA: methylmalonyl Co-A mutase-associated GTPase MeaB [Anaerolineales bacterium]|nr:methylmalonyl Co-A mutase-associated GTPase MeaB [Anaerolineaceae bacterium]HJO90269.1 methylmalonyl Co-A mutase-associated GTPase MeaB [Anaerolineales bacterium]|tara:strand:- start:3280 stop:4314 length:1035 start_codon:yes stop_codon:yes gene_type:complete
MSLIQQIIGGDRRALAQALTLIENDDHNSQNILANLYRHTGHSHIIGITGIPGVGKSTLINSLAKLMRKRDDTLGLLAIDPSSQFSQGAILGDRIRMRDLLGDKGVFIRSMATRGVLGGLSSTASAAVDILDAAGFDRVIVETVGVGQSEVDIASNAQTSIVVLCPGLGDSIQAAKSGLLEIADIIVINKSDYPKVNLTKSYLHEMIDIGRAAQTRGSETQTTISDTHSVSNGNLDTDNSLWEVPIITTVATTGEGVGDLFEQLLAHYNHIKSTGEMTRRRNRRLRAIFESQLRKQLYTKLSQMLSEDYCLRQLEVIMEGETDPYTAATNCIKHFETNYIGDEE